MFSTGFWTGWSSLIEAFSSFLLFSDMFMILVLISVEGALGEFETLGELEAFGEFDAFGGFEPTGLFSFLFSGTL